MTKKQDLIETAYELFCDNGFSSSGIDLILAKAQISKMTLYKHFKNKEDLIVEVIHYAHQSFVKEVIEKIDKMKISPKSKIIKFVEEVEKLVKKEKNVRCIFINACAEFPDHKNPIHKAALCYKNSNENFIKKLIIAAKIKKADHVNKSISAMMHGALVVAQMTGDKTYYAEIKKVINNLIKS